MFDGWADSHGLMKILSMHSKAPPIWGGDFPMAEIFAKVATWRIFPVNRRIARNRDLQSQICCHRGKLISLFGCRASSRSIFLFYPLPILFFLFFSFFFRSDRSHVSCYARSSCSYFERIGIQWQVCELRSRPFDACEIQFRPTLVANPPRSLHVYTLADPSKKGGLEINGSFMATRWYLDALLMRSFIFRHDCSRVQPTIKEAVRITTEGNSLWKYDWRIEMARLLRLLSGKKILGVSCISHRANLSL